VRILGHPDIHRDNVGSFAAGQHDRLAPVGRLTRNVHVGDGVDEQPEGGAQQRLVISEQDTDRHEVTGLPPLWGSRIAGADSAGPVAAAFSTGSAAVTWSPPAAVGPALTVPLAAATPDYGVFSMTRS
jgi:hypothetical protein